MMQLSLRAVVDAGLVRIDVSGTSASATLVLDEPSARCVAMGDDGTLYVGGDGVWRSRDKGVSWHHVEVPEPRVFSLAAAHGIVYAGTEPSRLYKSEDGGDRWQELDALTKLPSQPSWSFPPRPWTSHVRWVAPNPADPKVVLVGIELGGVMRTGDGGATWEDHRPGAQKDCHALAWHPASTDRAYEAAGGGAAWSRDGGATWEAVDEGRDRHYVWALAVDPNDPNCWFVSASTGQRQAHANEHAQAYVYRWRGDGPWDVVGEGLPRPLSSMPYVLHFAGGLLFAGLRDGHVYVSEDRGDTWNQLSTQGPSLQGLKAVV